MRYHKYMNEILSTQELEQALGFTLEEGQQEYRSPASMPQSVSTRIGMTGQGLTIESHQPAWEGNEAHPAFELRCTLYEGQWSIQRQAHAGIEVQPSAELALQGIRNVMAATPERVNALRARSCRP